jgi:hypothetical protein
MFRFETKPRIIRALLSAIDEKEDKTYNRAPSSDDKTQLAQAPSRSMSSYAGPRDDYRNVGL